MLLACLTAGLFANGIFDLRREQRRNSTQIRSDQGSWPVRNSSTLQRVWLFASCCAGLQQSWVQCVPALAMSATLELLLTVRFSKRSKLPRLLHCLPTSAQARSISRGFRPMRASSRLTQRLVVDKECAQ